MFFLVLQAGIIEEMMEDTLDQMDEVEEDATQEEIDKILYEVTAGEDVCSYLCSLC